MIWNSESTHAFSPPREVSIERKIFFLDLKENQRGRFMKITEDVGGRRDTGGAVLELLLALNREQGTTMVLVTHEPSLAESADRRIVLRDGLVVSQ